MPARATPLITGQFYHVFNRGANKQPIYLGKRDYQRALALLKFYQYASPKLRFSKFLLLNQKIKGEVWERLFGGSKFVNIICFCLMPNHFHFLVEQKVDNGISKFMANFQNSYTRFFNTKYQKTGSLLQGQFKAIRVEDTEQLVHLSRYIHLNPYASYITKDIESLKNYPWSSLDEYLENKEGICEKEIILSNFKSSNVYEQFVFDQASYQRELDIIKHLALEK